MGSSNDTSLGAYIELKGTYESESTKTVCENGHRMRNPHKFCSMCGLEGFEKKSVHTCQIKHIHEAFETVEDEERFTDVLQSPDYCDGEDGAAVFLGNRTSNYANIYDRAKEITPDMAELYISEFKKDYADILEFFDKRGFEYKIKFGVINYSN